MVAVEKPWKKGGGVGKEGKEKISEIQISNDTISGDHVPLEGNSEKVKAQFGVDLTCVSSGIVSSGIKDTLTLDIYLRVEHGKEGNWDMISSKVGEVDSNSFKLTGTKPAITVLPKDNGLKPKLSSLPKDIGPKPNLAVWKPTSVKHNGLAFKPKTQQLNSDKRPEACPQKVPTQPSVSGIVPSQQATKVSALISPTVGDSSSSLLQANVSEVVPFSYGSFVKDVASLQYSHHTILLGSNLEEGKVISITSTRSLEPLDYVSNDGLHNQCPSIRDFVGDLGKVWGNSKDWVLQLRDGRQITIPLSLHRSPETLSNYSGLEGGNVPGTYSFLGGGQITSWANECDGVVDFASADKGLECEVWKSDEGFVPFECSGEPLVVTPLASENPMESRSKLMELSKRNSMEVGSSEKIDSSQLSLWVINRIKAFKKSVGTSLEGFEEQVTGLFLALEKRRK